MSAVNSFSDTISEMAMRPPCLSTRVISSNTFAFSAERFITPLLITTSTLSSSIGKDSITGRSYRNGNVMYEVGLALASRQPTEVLLIRDDDDKFLFDVSTIPHITIDFTNKDASIVTLRDELIARLNERKFINDARIKLIISSLTSEECIQLKHLADKPHDELLAKKMTPYSFAVLSRLYDEQLIRSVGETVDDGSAAFGLTPFGYEVAQIVKSRLPQFKVVYENGENEMKT